MIILAGYLLLMLAAVILLLWYARVSGRRQQNQMLQAHMDAMRQFYAVMQDQIESIRRYRHDLAKHIRTLEQLTSRDETIGELQEYMETLKTRYEQLHQETCCADEIVNAVVTVLKKQCAERGIAFETEIEDVSYAALEEMDLVSLLYNLLDNAMEAAQQVLEKEQRFIRLQMRRDVPESGDGQTAICIVTENSALNAQNLRFETGKKDSFAHGIGMKIIDSVIGKYHGTRTVETEPGLVRMTVRVFPNYA